MFDTQTSEGTGSKPYILITTHYINSPVDKPDQWVLKVDQLAFMLLEGHHTGANIASIIACVLDEYGISGKVGIVFMLYTDTDFLQLGRFTADNTSNNDMALKALKDHLDPGGDCWDPVQH